MTTKGRGCARSAGTGVGGPVPRTGSAGFSLVEMVVAMLILTVGLLGLAGGMALTVRTVTEAEMNTDRTAALQTVLEELRAAPFDEVASGADTIGDVEVNWTATPSGPTALNRKDLEIVVQGPGRVGAAGGMPVLSAAAVDTFHYPLARP